jgi:hypothetical protein
MQESTWSYTARWCVHPAGAQTQPQQLPREARWGRLQSRPTDFCPWAPGTGRLLAACLIPAGNMVLCTAVSVAASSCCRRRRHARLRRVAPAFLAFAFRLAAASRRPLALVLPVATRPAAAAGVLQPAHRLARPLGVGPPLQRRPALGARRACLAPLLPLLLLLQLLLHRLWRLPRLPLLVLNLRMLLRHVASPLLLWAAMLGVQLPPVATSSRLRPAASDITQGWRCTGERGRLLRCWWRGRRQWRLVPVRRWCFSRAAGWGRRCCRRHLRTRRRSRGCGLLLWSLCPRWGSSAGPGVWQSFLLAVRGGSATRGCCMCPRRAGDVEGGRRFGGARGHVRWPEGWPLGSGGCIRSPPCSGLGLALRPRPRLCWCSRQVAFRGGRALCALQRPGRRLRYALGGRGPGCRRPSRLCRPALLRGGAARSRRLRPLRGRLRLARSCLSWHSQATVAC